MNRTLAIVSAVALLAMSYGCSSKNDIIGEWQYSLPFGESGKQSSIIEFRTDGTFTIAHEYNSTTFSIPNHETTGSYTTSNGTIEIVGSGEEPYAARFRIDGELLLLDTPDLETGSVRCTRVRE